MAKGDVSNIAKLVRIFVDQLQEAEDVTKDVATLRQFDYAVGQQLDNIGEIVGEERLGRDDAEYKDAIVFRIFINASNGEPETLITALRTLTQALDIRYRELHPAKVHMAFDATVLPGNLGTIMQGLCPAGVDLELVWSDADEPFIFTGQGISLPDTDGLGFSSTAQVEGGKLSSLIA